MCHCKILIADDESCNRLPLVHHRKRTSAAGCRVAIARKRAARPLRPASFSAGHGPSGYPDAGYQGLKAMRRNPRPESQSQDSILTAYDNFDYAKESCAWGRWITLINPSIKR